MNFSERRSQLPVPNDETKWPMAKDFSSLPEVIPSAAENDKEVAKENEKEVAGASEKQVFRETVGPEAISTEGDKQVAIDTEGGKQVAIENDKEALEWHQKRYTTPPRTYCGFRLRTLLIVLTAFVIVIALGVGLGIGLGLKRRHGSATTDQSVKSEQVLMGGYLDPAYYSTTGAFNGSGFTLSGHRGSHNAVYHVYFQHWTGEIRHMQLSSGGAAWQGGSASDVVAVDAKNGTTLSAVSYSSNGTDSWHLFYLDSKNRVRQRSNSNTTNKWVDGPLNRLNAQALDADQVGLLACWSGTTGDDFRPEVIEMQLWYSSNETAFVELQWVEGTSNWGYQQSWANLNGHSNPSCYSWAPGTITYVTFLDLDNRVNFYWKDLSSNLIGTTAHPVNQWVNSSITISNILPGSMAYTDYLYAQSNEDYFIHGYNISWAAENTSLVPGSKFTVQGDRPLPATHFACTAVPNNSGGESLLLLYQTTGNDIIQNERGLIGGNWTASNLQVPHN